MATRELVQKVTVKGSLVLDDLRWLVLQTENAHGASPVRIQERKEYAPGDIGPDMITVEGVPAEWED
jgi:hypothetical protein